MDTKDKLCLRSDNIDFLDRPDCKLHSVSTEEHSPEEEIIVSRDWTTDIKRNCSGGRVCPRISREHRWGNNFSSSTVFEMFLDRATSCGVEGVQGYIINFDQPCDSFHKYVGLTLHSLLSICNRW